MVVRRIVLVLIIMVTTVIFNGCFIWQNDQLPVYEREDNQNDGIVITIDGIKYKTYPEIKWRGQKTDLKIVGYAGRKKYPIYYCKDDPERDFIVVWDKDSASRRTSRSFIIPYRPRDSDASADSVDEIYFQDINFRIAEEIRKHRFIYDKDIIKTLFDELEANKDTLSLESDSIQEYLFSVTCYSEKVPGARYEIDFDQRNGVPVCGNQVDGYVEVSVEVLNMLAGYEVDWE